MNIVQLVQKTADFHGFSTHLQLRKGKLMIKSNKNKQKKKIFEKNKKKMW